MNVLKPEPLEIKALGTGISDCCDAGALANFTAAASGPVPVDERTIAQSDPTSFVSTDDAGVSTLNLLVENLRCAACISKIEGRLRAMTGITSARVNMSTRRLCVTWRDGQADPGEVMRAVHALGYPVTPFDPVDLENSEGRESKRLLSAMAVAGFAAANVMLLSVSIWSGHAGGMGEGTRTLFHWISALIALPAVVYAGQPFFRSALVAIKSGTLNMDVPISLAVVLASVMSVYQSIEAAEHAYFDASVSLLFFLLVGRYLDHMARSKARSAATHLMGLQARAATMVDADGAHRSVRLHDIRPGMMLHVAAGERIPIDGNVESGSSEVDAALITGESTTKLTMPGSMIYAGTLNLSAPLMIRATANADQTLLSEIVRLMEVAEQGRARYVRLADRIARVYAPVVHILAAATFVGWLVVGTGWESAMMTAVAVLIITCPCALGLAVPAVQVVASSRLLLAGVLVKTADALERLSQIDTVVFDKTGTLTTESPQLVGGGYDQSTLEIAASVAALSLHPVSRALAVACPRQTSHVFDDVREIPGFGIEAHLNGVHIRLGKPAWCGSDYGNAVPGTTEVHLVCDGALRATFRFEDRLRPDACSVIAQLSALGLDMEILSGDRSDVITPIARELGIPVWRGDCLPTDKVSRLAALARDGRRVLMVGDGLNDAPSLVAAHVSMSPATAADVSQTAADMIFQGKNLLPVLTAIRVARAATRLVKQNFALAFLYNGVAVPLAVFGYVTPLIAAIAMSSSSILVTANALRLRLLR